jgi:hypothetical protein
LSNTNPRKIFGGRWGCLPCREILAEPLQGIVLPFESAAMKARDRDMITARDKAQRINEAKGEARRAKEGSTPLNPERPADDADSRG